MSDEEFEAAFDGALRNTQLGVAFWLAELTRRESERTGKRMERLTCIMLAFTVMSALATMGSLILVVRN